MSESVADGFVSEANMEVPDIHSLASMPSKDMSSFSQVVFPEISDCFPPGEDVNVTYVLTDALQPSWRDWIGLFPVGWTSAREYYTFVWAPKASNPGDRTVSATFTAYYLPKDNSEFYQFCYVTREGHVRGASTPFQFRVPLDCDPLVEVEDENGMILLKTKSTIMEEQVAHLTDEKALLEKRLEELEQDAAKHRCDLGAAISKIENMKQDECEVKAKCEMLENEIADTTERLNDVTVKLSIAEATVAALQNEIDERTAQIGEMVVIEHGLAAELSLVKSENEKQVLSLNEQLDDRNSKVVELQTLVQDMRKDLEQKMQESVQKMDVTKERDDAKEKAMRSKEEKDLYRDQLAVSEEARQALLHHIESIQKQVALAKADVSSKAGKLAAYESKTTMLKNALKEAEKQNVVQKAAIESQLSNIEDKLNACDASKRLIVNELTEARDNRDRLMSELHVVKKEKDELAHRVDEWRQQLSQMDEEYAKILEQSDRSEQRYVEKERKLNEERESAKQRESALQEQIEILKSQLESADHAAAVDDEENNVTETSSRSAAKKESETIASLKAQIEDLSTRLSMGAAAYTEKYVECHKLEKKMKKLHSAKPAAKASIANLDEDSTTTDSQDDSVRGATKTVKVTPPVKQEQTQIGGNFMSRLEQLFMAIADPDVEEQERANRVKLRIEHLEQNVIVQHEKYKKYKKRYHDEKQSSAAEYEKSTIELMDLTSEVEDLKKAKDFLEKENESLKNQLKVLNGSSSDQMAEYLRLCSAVYTSSIRAPEDIIVPTVARHGYPHENHPTYPLLGRDPESDSDSSDKADSDFSDKVDNEWKADLKKDVATVLRDCQSVPKCGDVINRQPFRSPPMTEIGTAVPPLLPSNFDDDESMPKISWPLRKRFP